MNREIKFRGLSPKIDGKWHYGSFLNSTQQDFDCYIQEDNGNTILVDYETIGEYTGLKDKNGIEIYEGDLLKSYYDKPGIVKWNNEIGAFQIKGIPSQTMKRCYQMEVIGNIHDKTKEEKCN